ncbi:DNA polymerase III subunit alpha [Rossellomorea vietnamensis]|uniref:DNA polymerase III subunit alpha n=1 Tax=Rossellomorea vietnamensis TaxID=218284 RepID=UPI001E3D23AB|nr:DNA polymerase III subunit alpha [Rossellomorea vietnamensis]MCC5801276.1 DNA polymerase III subunit alpha [Rossellomorea vietnamensis]
MSFVHLQIASAYSLLSSTISINGLVHKAKESGYKALALTDKNMMYAAIPFYKACVKENIKPIIGLTADIASEEGSHPLVLLVKDQSGYQNLLKISSAIGAKSKEGLPLKWLSSYSKGLIAITPGVKGEIENLLLNDEKEKAKECIRTYQQMFGQDSFYLSIQKHGIASEDSLIPLLQQVAEETGTEMVATNDVQYIEQEDHFAHECMAAIRDGVKLSEDDRDILESQEYYFKTKDQMVELFSDHVEALENTMKIADRCHLTIPFHQQLLPKYPLPEGVTALEELTHLCEKGLSERVETVTDEYIERLDYELEIIGRMGFSDYFLIVWDFMKYAKDKKILTGPGRGSAAGSLVSYALRITDVDPLEHHLLFERFLNPERVTMPDIDIDFPDHRRDEVIEYVEGKYGSLHVAQIITFGTFAAKAALRDTGRVFGLNMKEQEQVSKLVPNQLGITLKEAYEKSKGFRDFVTGSDHYKKLFQTALKLEGLPRHTSTHAAGVVMSEAPLVQWVPIQGSSSGIHLTQYSMDILEEIGLLKMDFLGLRNLSILERIVKNVEIGTGKPFAIESIPMNDAKTFELLSKGQTNGIFQLESDGMRNVLKRLKPNSFEDIVAVNALYRPGPMENIPMYINRKHGKEQVEYPHPDLKPILKMTYGVIVYQEQIMQIASKMAGFSLGEADLLRRAVSKKKKDVLDQEREHFVSGSIRKGYREEVAHTIYDLIVRFADYGFNRSHAVAYSMIAYQLAYLKAHYPAFFLSSLLTSVVGNETKVAQYIREATQYDIEILPPSINRSQFVFTVEGKNMIRYSIGAIKGIGAAALKEIIRARKEKPFQDLFDFCMRVSSKTINRKILENLVLSGAFDEFGIDRATLLASLDVAAQHAELVNPDDDPDLFHEEEAFMLKPKYVEVDDMTIDTKLQFERQVLGLYLSNHPVSSYRPLFEGMGLQQIADLQKGSKISLGGYITGMKSIRTKKGEVMAFLEIGDESGEMEAVVFPNVYKHNMPLLKEGNILLFGGNVEDRNDKLQFIVNQLETMEEVQARVKESSQKLYLKIAAGQDEEACMEGIHRAINRFKGKNPVIVYYEQAKKSIRLPDHLRISPSQEALRELYRILGESNVILQ